MAELTGERKVYSEFFTNLGVAWDTFICQFWYPGSISIFTVSSVNVERR